ncbi:delta(3,5)-Delta(2,4)-dienoyl-CoA isomerase, mitochondrial-like [Sinocyclocheilus rhinocerous]|uniref:delta(3,5)-Delta(2,4)-dienoyl-CoA isomerase, mitochondrial-like n=1 Tax=Sinocyclocheilus rhinocerous TaxID=307959 RepID=UPI0007B858EF|nr:PREDICTED: delta(3,5)-Delta(2,4)-dienoyl-CoA isomerase, mitochondrial-like [Sinocyclocheilus rhinocerous]
MAYALRSAFRKQVLLIPFLNAVRGMSSSGGPTPPFTTLSVTRPAEPITHVEFCRPEKRNAMNKAYWLEMVDCFSQIAQDSECRVVVFSGAGKLFTSGKAILPNKMTKC